jgi:hypothetical protein
LSKISPIKDTKHYMLVTGISKTDKSMCYQIFNKQYDVLEIETHILPQALKYIEDLEAGLDALTDMGKVVPLSKKNIISGLN